MWIKASTYVQCVSGVLCVSVCVCVCVSHQPSLVQGVTGGSAEV